MPPQISVTDLPADATLLDVREQDEWDAGHAPGAVHVPLAEVPQRLGEVPEEDPVYVVCRGGGRSARAVEWLNQNGYSTVNVDGGMVAWAGAGKPLESAGPDAPYVR